MIFNPIGLYKYSEYKGNEDNIFIIEDIKPGGLYIIQRVKHLFWKFYIEKDRSFGTWTTCLEEIKGE